MKKIINGKEYDTDRAVRVGWSESEASILGETLYRKNTGEYFLAVHDGPSARWQSGWRIIPLTYEEAKNWAGTHLHEWEYKAAFGDPDPEEAGTENPVITPPVNLMADPENVEVWKMMMRNKAIRELPYDQQEAVYDDRRWFHELRQEGAGE